MFASAPVGRYSLPREFLRIVSDGQTVGTLRSELNEYTAEPAAESSPAIHEARQTLFRRFALLDRPSLEATSKGKRELKIGGGRRRVYVVHLRPRAPEPETWTEELWIDTERYVVLRSVFRDMSARSSPPRIRTITFERIELRAPDASQFTWSAPRGAKQVLQFRQPDRWDGVGPSRLEKQGP